MRLYPPWYLALARRACDEAGALLIVDEVFTGYGRTGTFWAVEAAGVSPDLLCTAKAFSGGLLPMAATLVSDRVFDAFLGAPERAFFYGHSFCGNPLGARVALEVLDVYAEEAVMEGVPERARRIAAAFERIGRISGTKDARSLGMIGAVDLAQDAGYLGRTGWRVHEEARRRGAYVRPLGDVVYVAPPINTPLDALDELLGIVEDSVARAL
jgi:adenosylmethionine-8-amino-7-oxononanoate aminotransferase